MGSWQWSRGFEALGRVTKSIANALVAILDNLLPGLISGKLCLPGAKALIKDEIL